MIKEELFNLYNIFCLGYFNRRTKKFKFNYYELNFYEMISGELKSNDKSDINLETKRIKILRNKYNVDKGFLLNRDNNF